MNVLPLFSLIIELLNLSVEKSSKAWLAWLLDIDDMVFKDKTSSAVTVLIGLLLSIGLIIEV